ncbi:sodium-coupled neutral amino acid transporter 9-like isoform X2 [Pocillopora damicornis]|uniref:sodium-coupled neutral amino acid transporter 9-like isoform X2 n=1 Tax=Pocillopora damicornis TaxID=46731 RepID=UPI000F559BB1|nr:sodium-coupled neutral amino acid transporter 9-like isoform X2 [Pocillopora damicornis]
MEGERSEYTRDKVVDEKSPLLSEQGDSSNAVKDRSRASNSSRGLYDSNSTHDGSLNSESSNNFAKRKPFHYNTLRNPVVTPHDMDIAAKFNRYRYISRLSRHNVIIPRHILPPHLFLVIPKESDEKQSSLVTIFSIWNTMMGTSLLSIPWAIDQAGFALAIILLVVMAGLCLYSCYLIIRCAEETAKQGDVLEFSDICKKYLGKPGEFIAILFSVAANAGGAIVFWVLMSSFLFYSGKYIHETVHHAYSVPTSRNITNGSFSPGHLEVLCPGGHSASASSANRLITADKTSFFKFWQLQHTVPLFLIAILFPLCSVKSPTFFTKFNSLGTLSVVYIVVFIITKASIWGIHMDFKHDSIPMFKASFPALTGILTLAYFIHNCILSIMRNQENPKNNVLLDNLPAPDIMTFIARLFLLFQLTTVFPLIVYIIRVQLMLYFFNKIYPSFLHIFVLNLALIGACVLFAVVYPHVGNIIRYVGSLSGLAYNYSLPCIVHMLIQKQKGQLSWPSTVFHSCIVVFGVLNFLSQFFING